MKLPRGSLSYYIFFDKAYELILSNIALQKKKHIIGRIAALYEVDTV